MEIFYGVSLFVCPVLMITGCVKLIMYAVRAKEMNAVIPAHEQKHVAVYIVLAVICGVPALAFISFIVVTIVSLKDFLKNM